MRIVFLDFDGVLNSHAYARRLGREQDVLGLDEDAVSRLNRLVEQGGFPDVVVSSSWRHGRTVHELRELLHRAGFNGCVIGKTPDCAHKTEGGLWHGAMRGNEVQSWLDLAPLYDVQVEQFVIIDDDSDMAHLADRHIKTSFETGLTDADVDRAIKMLAEPMPVVVRPSAETVLRFT
jgi:HAD domain in Swiss Army Knife RNA repair proteins